MSSPAALPLRFDARVQLARHPSGRTRSTMFRNVQKTVTSFQEIHGDRGFRLIEYGCSRTSRSKSLARHSPMNVSCPVSIGTY